MKKMFFTSLIVIFSFPVIAQPLLYALTAQGGANNAGTLVRFDAATNELAAIHHFDTTTGARPTGSLFQASDGVFYGMTIRGGANSRGVIFSFNPVTLVYNKLFDFSDSIRSGSDFIQVSGNKLLSTASGGANNKGVIFSFDISTSTYSKIHDFNGTDGEAPAGSLLKASNGILYGLTYGGGSRNVGVIFSYDYSLDVCTKLYDFTGSVTPPYDNFDGAVPGGSLIEASNGKFYGLTPRGGLNSSGTVFSFNPSNGSYLSIYSFPGAIWNPQGHLTQAINGKIYFLSENSSTSLSAGRIWSIDTSTNQVNTAANFGGANGYRPLGNGLLQIPGGKLYGMTARGGSPFTGPGGNGVVFSFDPSTSTITKLVDFSVITGILPFGSFIMNSAVQSPLPLVVTGFTATTKGRENNLQWFTMNERNISHIEIERSEQGIYFTSIGKVYSNNNNTATGTYSFTDTNPLTPLNYYRLKIIDKDQTYQYSEIKVVNGIADYKVELYPNPAPDNLTLKITSSKKSNLKIEIFSSDGKSLQTTKFIADEGIQNKKINIASLTKGNYILKVNTSSKEGFVLRFQKR